MITPRLPDPPTHSPLAPYRRPLFNQSGNVIITVMSLSAADSQKPFCPELTLIKIGFVPGERWSSILIVIYSQK